MSRAFVKETAESAPPPERMVTDGPNLVTPAGYAQIEAHIARLEASLKSETNVLLRETLERDLRYWRVAKANAEIVQPGADGVRLRSSGASAGQAVAFGSRVTILRNGREQSFQIVGADEADPKQNLISFRSPLAQAILGARAGDIVEMEKPPAEIEIVAIGR